MEKIDYAELFIFQFIEAVEFILGTISNTASYLRLWALSLAHGQLSKVFLELLFLNNLRKGGSLLILSIQVIFGFFIFSLITAAVIILMDTMECLLHALRLHWVEFQNKFFKGNGIMFKSFNYNS